MTKLEVLKTIESFRKLNNITQVTMAEKLGIKQSQLSIILNGKQEFTNSSASNFSKNFGFNPKFLTLGMLPIFDEDKKIPEYNYDLPSDASFYNNQIGINSNNSDETIRRLCDSIQALTKQNQTLIEKYDKAMDIILNKLSK